MSIERLKILQKSNDKKGAEMLLQSERFRKIANRYKNGTAPRAISAFNLFQTPEKIAEFMVEKISHKLNKGVRVLEPSAGLGRLYRAVYDKIGSEAEYTLLDNNSDCVKELYSATNDNTSVKLFCRDFLTVNPPYEGNGGLIIKELPYAFYDVIIMNPPFKMGMDIKHIVHAKKFLNSDGILVSLCYNGVKQNEKLKPFCDTWEKLPENSFKSEGTRAGVAMVTIRGEKYD